MQQTPFSATSQSGERRHAPLRYLAAQALLVSFATTMLYTASNARFLVDYGAASLPYVYIAIAIFAPLLSLGYERLQRRWALPKLIPATITLFIFLFLFGWFMLTVTDSRLMSGILMVVDQILFSFMLMVLNMQASRLFTLQEMKTRLPLVFAAMTIAAIVGGLLVPLFTKWLPDVSYLLLLGASTLVMMLLVSLATNRAYRVELRGVSAEIDARAQSMRQLLGKPYIRKIFTYQFFSSLGTYLVLFLFTFAAGAAYTTPEALATFFGTFLAAMMFAILLFLVAGSGPLLKRFGLRFGLMANPLVVLAIVGTLLLFDLSNSATGILFGLALAARIFDSVFSAGTTDPSVKAMYQTLPSKERLTVLTAVEGIAMPSARGTAGVLLLLFAAIPWLRNTHVLLLTIALTTVWAVAGWQVYRAYTHTLVERLKQHAVETINLSVLDTAAQQAVAQRLTVLKQHLSHPDPQSRRAVLATLARWQYQLSATNDIECANNMLRQDAAHGLNVLAARQTFGDAPERTTLQHALADELEQVRQRIYLLLALLYGSDLLLGAQAQMQTGDKAEQAVALEALSILLTPNHKAMLLPLLDRSLSAEKQIAKLNKLFPLPKRSAADWLQTILNDPDNVWHSAPIRSAAAHLALPTSSNLALRSTAPSVEPTPHTLPVAKPAPWAFKPLETQL